jgi:hypothetical protein
MYVLDVPITASFRDTLSIGDTIEITVHFRDSLLDVNSGEMIFAGNTAIDNRMQFTIPRLDTNAIDNAAERFFVIEEVIGFFTEQQFSTFSNYYMNFEQLQNERVFTFRLYPQFKGIFSVTFAMTTDLMQGLDVDHLSDCNDVIENIHYNTNNRSDDNNYYLQEESELYQNYESRLEWFNNEGTFAFVVE